VDPEGEGGGLAFPAIEIVTVSAGIFFSPLLRAAIRNSEVCPRR
jgi:hypothetical protein